MVALVFFLVAAQSPAITILKAFAAVEDGVEPSGTLIRDSSGWLYGVTQVGGKSNLGAVFKVRSDGSGFTLLHSFTGWDGDLPRGRLALDAEGWLYGTTQQGYGAATTGTVFKLRTDGSGFSTIHSFSISGVDGASPRTGLVSDGMGTLFGTTGGGGASSLGVIFSIKDDGSSLTVLRSFSGEDGQSPKAELVFDNAGVLYGTADGGLGYGVVYRIGCDGADFQVLHRFTGTSSDGYAPDSALVLSSSGVLYGATRGGGRRGKGLIYSIRTDGGGYAVLHQFEGGTVEGAYPTAGLVLDGQGMLFGTTREGGASGLGTVFKLKADGQSFTTLHSFSGGATDGGYLDFTGLVTDDAGELWGTTNRGGVLDAGTVYRLMSDGSGFTLLHSFSGGAREGSAPAAGVSLDSDGSIVGSTSEGGTRNVGTIYRLDAGFGAISILNESEGSRAGLVEDSDGSLYGVSSAGYGSVFKIGARGASSTALYTFGGSSYSPAFPSGRLVLGENGALYGTSPKTVGGGKGTIFTVNTDGTGFRIVYNFAGGVGGEAPISGMVLEGRDTLYGTTYGGGTSGAGTIFSIRTDGSSFKVLHSFAGGPSDGKQPTQGLVLGDAGTLYGTTTYGGDNWGVLFKINTDGTGYEVLRSFRGSLGYSPWGGLALDKSGNLYGTTFSGGQGSGGTVFTVNTDGTGYLVLHHFIGGATDGANPRGDLLLTDDGMLLGTTRNGGAGGLGTVFSLSTNGDPMPRRLVVTIEGDGSGTVSSSPEGISCGQICSALFGSESEITLTARADGGSAFGGWTGGGCSGTGPCQLIMTQYTQVTATFIPLEPSYLAGVAHAGGDLGSFWRSNLVVANAGTEASDLKLTFLPYGGGDELVRRAVLDGMATTAWDDVLVSLFDFPPQEAHKGSIRLESSACVVALARTYNQTASGTFGQYLPFVPTGQTLSEGILGVVPFLKNSEAYRSNFGVLNTGESVGTATVRFYDVGGAQVGATWTETVGPGLYSQLNDALSAVGAGRQELAYASVEVSPSGSSLWAFGSVVDNASGDPTTVPVVATPSTGPFFVAGVAHASGEQQSVWRTNVSVVYPAHSGPNALVTLAFARSGTTTTEQRSWWLIPGTAVEWQDVLVSLFGWAPTNSGKGSLRITSTQPIALAARTYNQGATGTYGQYVPAVRPEEGLEVGSVGLIPMLSNGPKFRSNLGLLNLSDADCSARVKLYNEQRTQVGAALEQEVPARQYWQQDRVFDALQGGTVPLGYATVEVLTPGCALWAFGSVVDNSTNDPTTVPVVW